MLALWWQAVCSLPILVFSQQAWRHCSSKLAIKRLWAGSISYWVLWAARHSLTGISPSPKHPVLARANNDKGGGSNRKCVLEVSVSAVDLLYADWHWHCSIFSPFIVTGQALYIGDWDHCTLVTWELLSCQVAWVKVVMRSGRARLPL